MAHGPGAVRGAARGAARCAGASCARNAGTRPEAVWRTQRVAACGRGEQSSPDSAMVGSLYCCSAQAQQPYALRARRLPA